MIVARNIESLMKSKDLDAAKLARASNINPTGIYDILSGKSRSPKIETISKIALGLGVPISAIFSEMTSEEVENEILFVFERLDDADRKRLIQTGRAWMTEGPSN
jgi:transcriptional regulator with XRE-family HTH domain